MESSVPTFFCLQKVIFQLKFAISQHLIYYNFGQNPFKFKNGYYFRNCIDWFYYLDFI
jgi:hypothetical protein